MLIGVFIRGYKSYRATRFIPINLPGKLVSVYIGQNGSGKSGILDALDKYFNDGEWCINSASRSNPTTPDERDPYVCPVFAIDKRTPISSLPMASRQQADKLNKLIREEIATDNPALLSPALKDFRAYIEANNSLFENYFITVSGKTINDTDRFFLGPFENIKRIKTGLGIAANDHATEVLKNLNKSIKKIYKYFYIPVEVDAEVFTKLGRQQVQHLLDESLELQVAKAIGNESINKIHAELTNYIKELNDHLSNYKYHGHQSKISTKDLAQKVFDHYFSSKSLHKDSGETLTPLSSLSSGEKRQALIDSIKSFLSRKKDRKNNIIIAIDEPDASLHVSACHDQFEKVASLSRTVDPNAQILITTHWYGFLPLSTNGEAHHISKTEESVEISTIDLSSYRESIKDKIKTTNGKFPIDAALKGYNDLVQSIFSSLLYEDPYAWIICEGFSDKVYLEHLLQNEEIKLRILPVGGISDVIRIYDRLQVPMSEKEYKGAINGSVICIIDTDEEFPELPKQGNANKLFFKRFAQDKESKEIILTDVWNNKLRSSTSIEDALVPAYYCSSIISLSKDNRPNSSFARELLSKSTNNKHSKYSIDALDYMRSDSHLFGKIFSSGDNKVDFAKRYCDTAPPGGDDLNWVKDLENIIRNK